VRGSVVDIRFDAHLPPIYSVLYAMEGEIVIEILAQLDAHRVRGIALTPTQGLARGMAVEDTGGPLQAPVGQGILSRMFDVFGNAIDVKPRRLRCNGVQCIGRRRRWRDVPPVGNLETGIKVIDVLVPLERGARRTVRRGGVGKTVLLTEMIHNMIGHHEGISCFAASASGRARARSCTAK